MVPCDEDLVLVRQRFQPVELCLDLRERAGLGEVAGVQEDVSGRDGRLAVVGVGEADGL